MRQNNKKKSGFWALHGWCTALLLAAPAIVFAQALQFNTGAPSLLSSALTIATAIAAIIVIGLAVMHRYLHPLLEEAPRRFEVRGS